METALRASAPTQHTARIVASCSSKASTSYASSLSKYRLTSQTQQQRARLSPCQAAADASGGDEPEFKKWTLSNLLSRKKNNGKGEGSDKPTPIPRKKSDWEEDWEADWDPQAGLSQEQMEMEEYEAYRALRRPSKGDAPRDKWITPLLDFQAIAEAFDPDQERTEQSLQDEALTNKESSQLAIRYTAQLFAIPLATGFIISHALAGPILDFILEKNPEAFAMTEHQKIEGAKKVHVEETRVRMDMAIGRIPPLAATDMLQHLREFALEVQEEERHHNEKNLVTLMSDSISGLVLFSMLLQPTEGRQALFSTLSRLFEGLSDIAKAVGIILIADTMLGYHSEEGWTGFIELVTGHYGIELDEAPVVIFVGVVPVAIDVLFKYWIFVGLNKISPSAVVAIKAIDRH